MRLGVIGIPKQITLRLLLELLVIYFHRAQEA